MTEPRQQSVSPLPAGGSNGVLGGMCNLYSLNKGQAAIIALTRAMTDRTGSGPVAQR